MATRSHLKLYIDNLILALSPVKLNVKPANAGFFGHFFITNEIRSNFQISVLLIMTLRTGFSKKIVTSGKAGYDNL